MSGWWAEKRNKFFWKFLENRVKLSFENGWIVVLLGSKLCQFVLVYSHLLLSQGFLISIEGLGDEGVANGWYCITLAEENKHSLKAQERLISWKESAR